MVRSHLLTSDKNSTQTHSGEKKKVLVTKPPIDRCNLGTAGLKDPNDVICYLSPFLYPAFLCTDFILKESFPVGAQRGPQDLYQTNIKFVTDTRDKDWGVHWVGSIHELISMIQGADDGILGLSKPSELVHSSSTCEFSQLYWH